LYEKWPFWILFRVAEDIKQVVLLWVQKFFAVCCASERSKLLFAVGKTVSEGFARTRKIPKR